MSTGVEPSPPPRTAAPLVSPPRVVAAVCIIAPFVAMLWIPSYNRETPKLLGFPFFYWYQLLWVVITALLMVVAYFAVTRDQAARRAAGPSAGVSGVAGSVGVGGAAGTEEAGPAGGEGPR